MRPHRRRSHGDRYVRVRRGTSVMADRHLDLPVVLGGGTRGVRAAGAGHSRERGDDRACNYARQCGRVGASGQSFAHGNPFGGGQFAHLGRGAG